MPKIFRFALLNAECGACDTAVENQLKAKELTIGDKTLKKIVYADGSDHIITIEIKNTLGCSDEEISKKLRALIEETGFKCEEKPIAEPLAHSHWLKGILGCVGGALLMGLCILNPALPMFAWYLIGLVSAGLTLTLGMEAYKDATKKFIKSRSLSADSLFTISSLTIIGVSLASFFIPGLPMMFDAGLMMFGFRHIGKAIEKSIKQKVKEGLSFKDKAPREIAVEINHKIVKKPIASLSPDHLIIVYPSQTIPLDGKCEDKIGSIYRTILNGNFLPEPIKRGEAVLAGMVVAGNTPLKIKVTANENDSFLARSDAHIELARKKKAAIETITNKILQYFIPTVLGVTVFTGITVGIFFNPALAIQSALTVLASACPCTLGFITPLAMKIGMAKAMENGVYFKNSKVLQLASEVDTVLLDYHGTLTKGEPVVCSYHLTADSDINGQTLWDYLTLMESEAQCPVAKAICNYTKPSLRANLKITELDKSNHAGLSAKINGEKYLVGNAQLLNENGISTAHINIGNADQVVYLVRNKKILGYVLLKDPIRDDAKAMITELIKLKKTVWVVSGGEKEIITDRVKSLGIPANRVIGGCVSRSDNPSVLTKTKVIEALQQQGHKVAMVGDALNDLPGIMQSEVGIAIKSNASDPLSQRHAGVVIQKNSLMPIVTTFVIANQTLRNIKQNLIASLSYNIGMMAMGTAFAFALGFALNPGIGVGLMVLETSLILLNEYRLKRQSLPHLAKHPLTNNQELNNTTYKQLQFQGVAPSNRQQMNINPQVIASPQIKPEAIPVNKEKTNVVATPKLAYQARL